MATLKDVAKAAGVSPITVSRVINSPQTVKAATRQRVEAAMQQLRYVTNTAARSLVSKKTGVAAVYIPENIDLSHPFAMQLIAGVSAVLCRRMYSFLIVRSLAREHFCDGYIVMGLARNEAAGFEAYAAERCRPVVLFGHTPPGHSASIDVDNLSGSCMGVAHLAALGHKRIAMINTDEDKDYRFDRLAGYRQALQNAGLCCDAALLVSAPNTPEGGAQAVRLLLARTEFTAVFCATDTLGIGAAAALALCGLRVPEQISLLGFDGLGHNLLATPHLTTVQQPVYEIGGLLAQTLLDKIDGRATEANRLVMPALLAGGSTAPPCDKPNLNEVQP